MNMTEDRTSSMNNTWVSTTMITKSSKHEVDIVGEICNTYVGPIICGFGVLGNMLNLIVLFKGKLKDTPYLYLKALAMADMFALLLSFIHLVFSSKSATYGWQFFNIYLFFPLVNFCTATSVWLTVGVTIDRFMYVKAPLWARAQFSLNRAKLRIVFILISTSVITIPRFLCFNLVSVSGKYYFKPTRFRSSTNYRIYDIICIALFHVAPLIIFMVSNTYLIYAVHKARSIRREFDIRNNKEKDWTKEQRRFTITLIAIVLSSIIAILPSTIGDFTRLLHIPFSQYHKLRHSSNMLLLANLAMNFLLYCAFNKRFVRVLKSLLGVGYIRIKLSIRRTRFSRVSRSETNVF